jgi:hypothetical protein
VKPENYQKNKQKLLLATHPLSGTYRLHKLKDACIYRQGREKVIYFYIIYIYICTIHVFVCVVGIQYKNKLVNSEEKYSK